MADDTKADNSETQEPKREFGILAARFLKKTAPTGEHAIVEPATSTPSADDDVLVLDDDMGEPASAQSTTGELPLTVEEPLSQPEEGVYEEEAAEPVPQYYEEEEEAAEVVPQYYESEEAAEPVSQSYVGEEEVAEPAADGYAAEEEASVPVAGSYEEAEDGAEPIPQYYASEEAAQLVPQSYEEDEEAAAVPSYEEGEEAAGTVPPSYEEEVAEPTASEEDESGQPYGAAEYVGEAAVSEYVSQEETAQYESESEEVAQYSAEEVSASGGEYEPGKEEGVPTEGFESTQHGYSAEDLNAIGSGGFSSGALDALGAGGGYSKSDLDSIGTQSGALDKSELDSIGAKADAPKSPPDSLSAKGGIFKKAGIGSKGLFKKPGLDSIGAKDSKKSEPEPIGTTGGAYDKSALDSLGAKGAYDKSALDSIGSKGGAFDASALDSIGTKDAFDKSALDSIGAKSSAFDASALDSIGTKDAFDKSQLDSIGAPSASPAAEASPQAPLDDPDKAEQGKAGLGGTFKGKAKSLLDKRAGGIQKSSAAIQQRDTAKIGLTNQFTPQLQNQFQPLTPEPVTAEEEIQPGGLEPLEPLEPDDQLEAEPDEESEDESATLDEPEVESVSTDPTHLIADADKAFKMRQYAAAEKIYAKALRALESEGRDNDPLLVACLDRSGDNLYELKKYKEALPFFRRLIILHEKLGSPDRDLIASMYKIAKTSEMLNLTNEADSMYKRAFRLGQQSLVPGDPLLANVLEGYGNMLMRSEGGDVGAPPEAEAEPESVEIALPDRYTDAQRQSMLSPEEIALLSKLEVKGDETTSPKVAIVVPAADASKGRGPAKQASVEKQGETTGKRLSLREAEDKIKYRPPSSSGGSTSGANMAARTLIFVGLVFGALQYAKNIQINYTKPKPVEIKIIPGPYNGNVYTAADGLTVFTMWTDNRAYKEFLSSKIAYDYKPWNGSFSDDMDMFSGKVKEKDFGSVVSDGGVVEGFRDPDGNFYFRPDAPEVKTVVVEMREAAAKLQTYYKAHGKYPENADLAKAEKIEYKNPFVGGPDAITTHSIKWPPDLNNKQIFVMSPFDTKLENGTTWDGESGKAAGEISVLTTHIDKAPAASVGYIHARDRHGELIKRSDGKTYILIFKNGLDVTPVATLPVVKDKSIIPLRVTNDAIRPTVPLILLNWLMIAGFYIGSIFFLIKYILRLRAKGYASGPSLILPFASGWSLFMGLLTLAPKFAPPPYSDYLRMAVLPAFMVGLVLMLAYLQFSKPKKKKAEPET